MEMPKKSKKGLKIALWILGVIVVLGAIGGGVGYYFYNKEVTNYAALTPKSKQTKEVHIASGSTPAQIAAALDKAKVLRSQEAFMHYVKSNNVNDLKAGYYELSPAMTVKQLVTELRKGGSATSLNNKSTITIREGETAEAVATELAAKSDGKFTKDAFLNALNDDAFIQRLNTYYPDFLTSAIDAKDVRYRLEGYLYPATYDWKKYETVEKLINYMVYTSYATYKPYFDKIKASGMTTQQVLTLASLVEREGIDKDSRRVIAGVFENRIDANMSLGSDIAVKYALDTDKTNLSNADVRVDSPYNLYKYTGYGPGPFNNPSLESVEAVLDPKDRDKGYLYFVANLSTGKIYYSKNYDEHLEKAGVLEASNNSVASSSSAKKASESSSSK